MSAHRTHRPDRNSDEIINAFQGLGCYVANTGMVGNGFPDLVVGVANQVALVEVKFKSSKLTEKQLTFHAEWLGAHLHTIRSLEDVGALVKAMKMFGVDDMPRRLTRDELIRLAHRVKAL